MLKDALEFLFAAGKKSSEVQRVHLPGNKLIVSIPGEDIIEVDGDSERISDTVVTLSDLQKWIEENTSEEQLPDVFVSAERVYAVASRLQLHNTVDCQVLLEHSQAFKALSQWIKSDGMKQQSVVRMLRGALGNTFEPSVLSVFKRLDFARLAAANVSHTSLGRSVEEKAQSAAGDVPEQILFKLPYFNLPGSVAVNILCAVEIDSATQNIAIFPVGDALEDAKRATLLGIQQWLQTSLPDWVTVYAGEAGYRE